MGEQEKRKGEMGATKGGCGEVRGVYEREHERKRRQRDVGDMVKMGKGKTGRW